MSPRSPHSQAPGSLSYSTPQHTPNLDDIGQRYYRTSMNRRSHCVQISPLIPLSVHKTRNLSVARYMSQRPTLPFLEIGPTCQCVEASVRTGR
jgi:hypothetical protein